jgi:hypothetical protein
MTTYKTKPTNALLGGGGTNSSCPRPYDTKPSVNIIAHGVGVIPAHSAGASLGHRRWYGPKPLIAMVSGKRDVSGETDAEKWVTKVSWKYGTFLRKLKK